MAGNRLTHLRHSTKGSRQRPTRTGGTLRKDVHKPRFSVFTRPRSLRHHQDNAQEIRDQEGCNTVHGGQPTDAPASLNKRELAATNADRGTLRKDVQKPRSSAFTLPKQSCGIKAMRREGVTGGCARPSVAGHRLTHLRHSINLRSTIARCTLWFSPGSKPTGIERSIT